MDGDNPAGESSEGNERSYENAFERLDVFKQALTWAHEENIDHGNFMRDIVIKSPEFFMLMSAQKRNAEEAQTIGPDFQGTASGEPTSALLSYNDALVRVGDLEDVIKDEQEQGIALDNVIESPYAEIYPEIKKIFDPVDKDKFAEIVDKLIKTKEPPGTSMADMLIERAGGPAPKPNPELEQAKMNSGVEKYNRRQALLEKLIPGIEKLAEEYRSHKVTFGRGGDHKLFRKSPDESPVLYVWMGLERLNGDAGNWQQHSRFAIIARGGREVYGIKEQELKDANTSTMVLEEKWEYRDVPSKYTRMMADRMEKPDKNGYYFAANADEILNMVKERLVTSLQVSAEGYGTRRDEKRKQYMGYAGWAGAALAATALFTDYDDKVIDWIKETPPVQWIIETDDAKVGYGGVFESEGKLFVLEDPKIVQAHSDDAEFDI